MSRPPTRHRAPVSSRASAAPAVGSLTTCSVLTRSRTSGVASRPPSPTSSTGTPRARSAPGDQVELRPAPAEHRDAAPAGRSRRSAASSRHTAATWSASQSASSATVSSRAARTTPGPPRGPGDSAGTFSRISADSALATSRTCSSLRNEVDSGSTGAGSPAAVRKWVANRIRLFALAPRQP
jgi:hypothetical protein